MIRNILLMAALLASTFAATSQHQVKQSFTNVTEVEIEGIFCQVNIDAANQDQVDFEGSLQPEGISGQIKILHQQNGSKLRVWIETPKRNTSNVTGTLTFKVPMGTNVNVHNVSGNVKAIGLAGTTLQIHNVSGNIQARNIQKGMICKTVSGSITTDGIGGNLNASTVSGSLNLKGIKGSLTASSTSGLVNVQTIDGDCAATSVSGSISVAEAKGNVTCSNISGQVKLAQINGAIKAKTVSGSIYGDAMGLNGESWFNSVSGSVTIKTTQLDNLSFVLKSASGHLSVGNVSGKDKLVVEKGAIPIHGETVSGSIDFK